MSPELLRSIQAFCQLDEAPEVWQGFEREFDASQTSHRRAAATPEEIELIRRWIEPTACWLAKGPN
jgi:hypothetical protein